MIEELDERREQVLRAVVEEYVATAEPVGSARVAGGHVGVSSATVRNEMAALERDGYLDQPYTSAGRVPTDKGYRYFVDHLGRVEALGAPYAAKVSDFFARAQTALEDMLHQTTRLLAGITEQAALVVGPQADDARIMSSQLVTLQRDVVLVVTVLSNGAVEKAAIRLEEDVEEETVERAGSAVTAATSGSTLAGVAGPEPTGEHGADRLASLAVERIREFADEETTEPVYVGGTSNIAAEAADFSASETVSRLLEMLEQQFLVVTLARNLIDSGVTVRIGEENERVELRECAVIMAPVILGDGTAGTVGVLGPTRMDYARAMAAVTTVSERLARHLTA